MRRCASPCVCVCVFRLLCVRACVCIFVRCFRARLCVCLVQRLLCITEQEEVEEPQDDVPYAPPPPAPGLSVSWLPWLFVCDCPPRIACRYGSLALLHEALDPGLCSAPSRLSLVVFILCLGGPTDEFSTSYTPEAPPIPALPDTIYAGLSFFFVLRTLPRLACLGICSPVVSTRASSHWAIKSVTFRLSLLLTGSNVVV